MDTTKAELAFVSALEKTLLETSDVPDLLVAGKVANRASHADMAKHQDIIGKVIVLLKTALLKSADGELRSKLLDAMDELLKFRPKDSKWPAAVVLLRAACDLATFDRLPDAEMCTSDTLPGLRKALATLGPLVDQALVKPKYAGVGGDEEITEFAKDLRTTFKDSNDKWLHMAIDTASIALSGKLDELIPLAAGGTAGATWQRDIKPKDDLSVIAEKSKDSRLV